MAVVTVSYNTRELTALLLWSLYRVLDRRPVEVVVVDNGSSDGSAELLSELQDAGLCTLVANVVNVQHGPALNRRPARQPIRGEVGAVSGASLGSVCRDR